MITGGAGAGSVLITGKADPRCVGGTVQVFDCNVVEHPPVCYNGNDVLIGTGTRDANGNFVVPLAAALTAGQVIYAADACGDPLYAGPGEVVIVRPAAPVPTMSANLLGLLVASLCLFGMRALRYRLS